MEKRYKSVTKAAERISADGAQRQSNAALLIVCFLCMTGLGISQNKLTPLMTDLMSYWDVLPGKIGILQSAQNWVVIFLLLPIGLTLKKLPPKFCGIVAFALMLAGSLIGIMSGSFSVLVLARVLDGVGQSIAEILINTVIVTNISKRRVLAVGLVNAGNYLGQVVYLNLAPVLIAHGTWRLSYRFVFIWLAILLALWIVLVRRCCRFGGNISAAPEQKAVAQTAQKRSALIAIKERDLWLIALSTACFGCAIPCFGSFIPTYWTTRGMELAEATRIYSYAVFFGMCAMFLSGIIVERFKSKRKLIIACFWTCMLILMMLRLPLNFVYLFIVMDGLVPRMILPATQSSIPDLYRDPTDVPVANSFTQLTNCIFTLINSIFIGHLIQIFGYSVTITIIMGVCFLGGLSWLFVRKVK